MSRFGRFIYPTEDLCLRVCKSRDPYRVRVLKTEDVAESYYIYALSFYKAAHKVACYLIETDKPNISELDTFFFPLAFLYRHSVELLLKAIVFQYITDKDERASLIKTSFHNLANLFQVMIGKSDLEREPEEIVWLIGYFDSLSDIDRESDSFRYPFHIGYDEWFGDGFFIKRIFEEQTHIDLVKFANKFEACFEILDSCYLKSNRKVDEWRSLEPQFIECGGYYYGQSVVGYSFSKDDFYPYTHAYTEVAGYLRDLMKKLFSEKNYDEATVFFLPMSYLYRNCVELVQKAIWFEESGENIQKKCSVMMECKHSVAGMWKHLEPYIISCGSDDEADKEYVSLLKKYTFELHDYDSDANRFRYPTNKEMQPYFHDNKWFDFMRVADFFGAIINAYDGIHAVINERNEYEAEMMAEYYSEMNSEY